MAQQQQTVLRVETNIPNDDLQNGFGYLVPSQSTGVGSYTGNGIKNNPYIIQVVFPGFFYSKDFAVKDITTVYYTLSGSTSISYDGVIVDTLTSGVKSGVFFIDSPYKYLNVYLSNSSSKVQLYNVPPNQPTLTEDLDLYTDIPIKINKSFAELQDISKRNSDYSIGLSLPGSKKNNSFFEGFFNVDNDTLYFNALRRVPCKVLMNDQTYFNGFMKLNKVSVLNSKVEYDVTLFSTMADLFGQISNNLLKDLDFSGQQYSGFTFNHTFSKNLVANWNKSIFSSDEVPNYFYPVVHNGYNYKEENDDLVVDLSGATSGSTRLFTTTLASGYTDNAAAYAAGVKRYRINSPEDGIYDNQLKPALSVKKMIELIFKTYGYSIKSDFFNTPWFRLLYMYGYFNDDKTKFSYKFLQQDSLPVDGIDISVNIPTGNTIQIIPVKKDTGIPITCSTDLKIGIVYGYFDYYFYDFIYDTIDYNIPANSTGLTTTFSSGFWPVALSDNTKTYVKQATKPLAYLPPQPNTVVSIVEGSDVDFNKIITPDIKQIDFLSSIAKKFNLVFIPNPDNQFEITIEPYQYYIGSGQIYDWTNKLSFDKGFTVEPALNYLESELFLTDQEDGDAGNKFYKDRNNRIYGQNIVYNPTDFKSQQKKIDTIFSPEVIRKWDTSGTTGNGNVQLPLGINYSATNENINKGDTQKVVPAYKGAKTKPKLMYYLGTKNPFLDTYNEIIPTTGVTTNKFRILSSDGTSVVSSLLSPVISHTMPIGNPDSNKKTNDSICNLFNSEQPTDVGVETYNVYTDNDIYKLFYQNRVANIYNKDTRFLNGYFNLNLSDINNLKPIDLIKVNEQYFTWNKIDSFDLTNPELTKVELIQVNNTMSTYPDRYFKYYYCDNPSVVYKFKTDFTNPSLSGTSYGWSIEYDYNVGILSGNTSGYTSTIYDVQSTLGKYVPYSIYEVTKTDYEASGLDRNPNDTLWMYCTFTGVTSGVGVGVGDLNVTNFPSYVANSGNTIQLMNVFTGCTDFSTKATANGIRVGSSTYHGGTPPVSIYSSGVTLNITDTGWIKYNSSAYPTGTYQYMGSTGNVDLGGCVDCSSINYGYPFSDLAAFTIVDCGTACP